MSDKIKDEENPGNAKIPKVEKLLPPIYSRQLKFFGIVIWSDTRQLDEEVFFERIASRINGDLAKELLILKSKNGSN